MRRELLAVCGTASGDELRTKFHLLFPRDEPASVFFILSLNLALREQNCGVWPVWKGKDFFFFCLSGKWVAGEAAW